MKRTTAVLTTCGAIVLSSVVVGVNLTEAVRPAGSTFELRVAGVAGVPSDALAVVLNLTSAGASGTGYVAAYPCGTARPNASNLNYGVGAPVANSAIVKVGTGGKVCLFTADNDTELIADINGYFPANSNYTSMTPSRLLDTRRPQSTIDGAGAGEGLRRAGDVYELQVGGRAGVPTNAAAVVLNLTSAEARGTGYATAYPCGTAVPNASNLNYGVGAPVANSAIVKVGAGGKVCLFTADTDTQLIADINGYFPTTSSYIAMTPSRLLDTRDLPTPSGAVFVETFNAGTGLQNFRTGVFHRNPFIGFPGGHGGSWTGDHDLACGAPETQRPLQSSPNDFNLDEIIYLCKDHMMTSMGDVDGYSVLWLAPNQIFNGQTKVAWDVNVTDLEPRQWWEVAIIPAGAPEATAIDWIAGTANLDEYPAGSVVVGNGPFGGTLHVHSAGVDRVLTGICSVDPEGCASKAIRRTWSVTDNRNGTVTVVFGGFSETVPGSFPAGAFEVVFKDHNYTPDKDAPPVGHTWHWDNIIVG